MSLTDNFFRNSYSTTVSILTARFGGASIDRAEDAVQYAQLEALRRWRIAGAPERPEAWIVRVATNRMLDGYRHDEVIRRAEVSMLEHLAHQNAPETTVYSHGEVADSQLRMIFACCHPELPLPSQVALALKLLCAFDVDEIAAALLIRRENAKKRVTRAKQHFVSGNVELVIPSGEELDERLDAVHAVLYALFSAGYYSDHPDGLVRDELCAEALRLISELCEHEVSSPATFALLALCCFHAARAPARLDTTGGLLLMEEQDRTKWDEGLLAAGWDALGKSASGTVFSRYHAEAGIAAVHARASSFEETDWQGILELYDALSASVPSPVTALNRAVALSFADGVEAGLRAVSEVRDTAPDVFRGLPDIPLVSGALHLRSGRPDLARASFRAAAERTRSPALLAFLQRQLRRCDMD